MRKCIFIIPYFGRLPDSFPVFLKTCGPNKDFDFLLFTDDDRPFDYPENFRVIPKTFDQIRELIQSKFDFEISLERPYKLCDYKPAYGYIFEDYINDHLFWGHCDIDTILGDLGQFLTDDLLSRYDKLFCLGHMILYRNTPENNRMFMKKADGRELYREYFSTNEITAFDETWGRNPSVHTIFEEYGLPSFNEDWSVNFKILPTAFTEVKYRAGTNSFEILPRKKTVFTWENGKVFRHEIQGGEYIRREEMYMHFQSRKMRFSKKVPESDYFQVVPNRFIPLKQGIDNMKAFKAHCGPHLCFHYFEIKWGRLMKRIRKSKKGTGNNKASPSG
ncbi:MAG: hypothetical protein K5871_06615 [Lachnospiraceae bacterium]|nr:hypothetical protein [Lachnospiraceae bacterium]